MYIMFKDRQTQRERSTRSFKGTFICGTAIKSKGMISLVSRQGERGRYDRVMQEASVLFLKPGG